MTMPDQPELEVQELVEGLADADPAEAPEIAEDLAERLGHQLDGLDAEGERS